jgi:hypothetical protein
MNLPMQQRELGTVEQGYYMYTVPTAINTQYTSVGNYRICRLHYDRIRNQNSVLYIGIQNAGLAVGRAVPRLVEHPCSPFCMPAHPLLACGARTVVLLPARIGDHSATTDYGAGHFVKSVLKTALLLVYTILYSEISVTGGLRNVCRDNPNYMCVYDPPETPTVACAWIPPLVSSYSSASESDRRCCRRRGAAAPSAPVAIPSLPACGVRGAPTARDSGLRISSIRASASGSASRSWMEMFHSHRFGIIPIRIHWFHALWESSKRPLTCGHCGCPK